MSTTPSTPNHVHSGQQSPRAEIQIGLLVAASVVAVAATAAAAIIMFAPADYRYRFLGGVVRAHHVPQWAYSAYLYWERLQLMGRFDADLIEDGLWLGSHHSAMNLGELQKRGITAVVSAVDNELHAFAQPKYNRKEVTIQSLRIHAVDDGSFDMSPYFDRVIEFIESHHQQKDHGSVLVHCRRGMSRSATLVLAFLMKRNSQSLVDALEAVRQKRPKVQPIEHFMTELRAFEFELRKTDKKVEAVDS